MCFFGFITRFLVIIFGILVPARYTHKALGVEELNAWGKYWVVYAWLVCMEVAGDTLFNWLPLYAETKLLIVLWLVISAPQASVWVFDSILSPLLGRYMTRIDDILLHGKRHLLRDALSYTVQLCSSSIDTLVPKISLIWKKASETRTNGSTGVDTATEASNPPFQEVETVTNSNTNVYYDPNIDDESFNVASPTSSYSNTFLPEQRKKLSKLSLPDLAMKASRPPISRPIMKQYVYDMPVKDLSLSEDPLSDMEDLLKSERIAAELHHRPISMLRDHRRHYQ
ncbi:receptor expression-enhancing protein 3 [Drosophila virilis]|uniref:receptor expression-enhancing protein 3 n=1 Tax=Drosophila virilis TaxID=7244 RepID=UPI00017D3B58|nr:receptor expression-enhancing protein 3 [Drosophila virilis]